MRGSATPLSQTPSTIKRELRGRPNARDGPTSMIPMNWMRVPESIVKVRLSFWRMQGTRKIVRRLPIVRAIKARDTTVAPSLYYSSSTIEILLV